MWFRNWGKIQLHLPFGDPLWVKSSCNFGTSREVLVARATILLFALVTCIIGCSMHMVWHNVWPIIMTSLFDTHSMKTTVPTSNRHSLVFRDSYQFWCPFGTFGTLPSLSMMGYCNAIWLQFVLFCCQQFVHKAVSLLWDAWSSHWVIWFVKAHK